MGTDRQKRKTESARDRRSAARAKSGFRNQMQPSEFDPMREEFNHLWTSWVLNNTSSDMWRRIEQSGLDNALKKLHNCKGEFTIITSINSDDAANLSGVMAEMVEMLSAIRQAFVENEKEILDNDEHEKRYLTHSGPTILKIWNEYSVFACEFATNFVQKGWLNSSEHKELLSSVGEVAASAVKLLVLTANMADYHSLDDAEVFHNAAVKEATCVSKETTDTLAKVVELGDSHTAIDSLMELVGWMVYGLNHAGSKVVKAGIESKAPDSNFEDYNELTDNLSTLLTQLHAKWGGDKKIEEEPQQTVQQNNKKSSKKATKPAKNENSKDVKLPDPPADDKQRSKENYLDVLQKLADAYKTFSDNAWETQRLPVIKGMSGVQMKYRMECYEQLGKLRVDAALMTQRKSILDSLQMSDDHQLHSDLYIIGPEALACSSEVIIQFPLLSKFKDRKGVYLTVRSEGNWTDTPEPELTSIDGTDFLIFRTTGCEAFAAICCSPPDGVLVGPAGIGYVSETNGKVEMFVPQDCFESEVQLGVKVLEFDKEAYGYQFVGIVAASLAVDITSDSDVTMKKHVTIQVPVIDDEDDKDTELVVVRCNESTVQVLDRKQITIRATDRNGLYCVDVKGCWCVAILRIRRIFLNMRESVKKEFLVGYGKRIPCVLLTYIDDLSRGDEAQIFMFDIQNRIRAVTETEAKRSTGIIEVKKSRSKDVFLKRGDLVQVKVDGQMRLTEAMSEDQQTICFLPGCSNTVSMATEIKRDPEKLPDAMVFYKNKEDGHMLHSVAIMTRDLSELPTEDITARTGINAGSTDAKKEKEKEEAAVQILKMESLMSLARELTFDEGRTLGEQLGVKPETIKHIKDTSERDPVAANFQILCNWRGRFARATMADFLISSLKAVGKMSYADVVLEVRKHNRGLVREDFERTKARRKATA